MKPFAGRSSSHLLFSFVLLGAAAGVNVHVLQQRSRSSPNHEFYPGYNDVPLTVNSTNLHPVIQDFQALIERDAQVYMGFQQMLEQVPIEHQLDAAGIGPQIRDYKQMLYRLNQTLSWAPAFGHNLQISFPISTVFYWEAFTTAGYRMLTNDDVNAHLKRILSTWAEFLSSPESRYTLTHDGGWLSPQAFEAMGLDFVESFECDPEEEYFGYKSWDDYFTRKFKEGVRPVDAPEDASVITNPCESTPYRIAHDVQEQDMFWIKEERYSLRHMLNNDPLTSQFVGGTVFQSFLSGLNYHRWHSPVDGTIVKTVSIPGTYYAVSTSFSFEVTPNPDLDHGGYSQGYMASVATRMLIFIQADNPDIGLMVLSAIGMGEVSSCEATVKEGERVKKGDQLGMFHFGGSTYVMIFRPETKIEFVEEAKNGEAQLLLNRRVAIVRS